VFIDALRLDLHGTGVHAMTLCPGFVRTPLTAVLDKTLPFLIDCEEAVDIMVAAIAARKKTFSFPWQMRLMSLLFKHGPESLIRKLAPAARTRAPE
jgi:short-subunit dehydrogenase